MISAVAAMTSGLRISRELEEVEEEVEFDMASGFSGIEGDGPEVKTGFLSPPSYVLAICGSSFYLG
jgi:hypothetical protein